MQKTECSKSFWDEVERQAKHKSQAKKLQTQKNLLARKNKQQARKKK
jgi:hypothetical protein|tara:strand:- start:678 stop:818 length:141 start_codon:yes stop_codon:yes gene_type:complete